MYFKELSTTKNLDSVYESNLAIEGGAIFSAGFANVVDSTFESNAAESVSFFSSHDHDSRQKEIL